MHALMNSHLNIAMRVLRYLKGSPSKGFQINKTNHHDLVAYVDSDWGKTITSRKSVTGFSIFLNGSLISWKSKKQGASQDHQLRLNSGLLLQ